MLKPSVDSQTYFMNSRKKSLFQIPDMTDSLKRNFYTAMVYERSRREVQRHNNFKFIVEI